MTRREKLRSGMNAGFETPVAVEIDDDCVATLRANRQWPVIHRSIHDIPSAELLQQAGFHPDEADVLIGGREEVIGASLHRIFNDLWHQWR